ncbi:MAG: hypothetical protein SOV18_05495, partial [Eubacteriales bacterium]|nr:hypothetical protein [Eubacteriales bacterium]
RQQNSLALILFSPREPLFRGTTGRQQNSLALILFSPREPLFRGTTGRQQNSLRLFCFLPVNLVFVAAFAALKVSFPGACPGKDVFYFDEETTGNRFA